VDRHPSLLRWLAEAITALVAAALAVAAVAAPAAAAAPWRAPVDGPVTRPFRVGGDPFAPGLHRGSDFAAAPGTTVHAACGGRVVVAGRVGTNGRLVTIRCGRWRATHMPLATIAVRAGTSVRRGAELGTVAPSADHEGLHLGARREGARFEYVDPLDLIGADPAPPPPVPLTTRKVRTIRLRPALAPQRLALRSPPAHASPETAGALAPWPAWAGLVALLGGAVGTSVRVGVRARGRGRVRDLAVPRAARQEAR
jgi:hypothetical protein